MTWQLIRETPPPTDNSEFIVGMWVGDPLYDNDYNTIGWRKPPVWQQRISHHEGAETFKYRGWNHRNGPLGGDATHWHPLSDAPEQTLPVLEP